VDAEIVRAAAREFDAARRAAGPTAFERRAELADGARYLGWSGVLECVVSPDARRIAYRPLPGAGRRAVETYLAGHVLSFALLARGGEPLHATAVVLDGRAVAFAGDCGYGKSTLAAEFLRAGHSLLTDDLLVVKRAGGARLAYPGAPRIKLCPDVVGALPEAAGAPMNPITRKLVVPLTGVPAAPVPLARLYVLPPPWRRRARGVEIQRLSARRAFVEITRATFNAEQRERARLARQFAFAADLAATVPVKRLSFPRELAWLPAARAAIERDAAS